MSVNNESDSTYCSVFESSGKRRLKVKRKSTSAILDDIYKKIKNHVDKKQLLNPFDVIKYKQQISKMRLNSYKLKFHAEKIKTYLNGIYKQSKSVEEILLDNGDPLWDCGISQDLRMLNGCNSDLNPIALPAQIDNQSFSFDTDMLSNQLFITDFSQNSAKVRLTVSKSPNIDVISVINCTQAIQNDHDKFVCDQSLINIENSEESLNSINNKISENVIIKDIHENIGLIPSNYSSASFKSDVLSNQNFLLNTTNISEQKSSIPNTNMNFPLVSQDLFTQKEINQEATESEYKINNSTEFNWTPTKKLNQIDNLSFNGLKNDSNKQFFDIVKKPNFKCSEHFSKNTTNIKLNSSITGTTTIDETQTISLDESLNIITSINGIDCDKMDIDSSPCSDLSEYYIKKTDSFPDEIIFKKPFKVKRKPIVSSQVNSSSNIKMSAIKKSEKNDIDSFKPVINECEELCNLTKKFLNIVEATNEDSKKTIEVLKNISNPSSKTEFQKVSEIGIFCTESFNKKINSLFYNIGSGSENWEDAAKKLDETNYLHQEISDWLKDVLDNISNEDKIKMKEAFNSLENEVANCLDPKDSSDLDITSLFHSNYRRLKEMSNEFNRKLILDDFKCTPRNDKERFTDLSCFDWKKLL